METDVHRQNVEQMKYIKFSHYKHILVFYHHLLSAFCRNYLYSLMHCWEYYCTGSLEGSRDLVFFKDIEYVPLKLFQTLVK